MMQATRLPLQKSDPLSTEVLSSDSADGSGMDEFGYLAVILSIILGLSVTNLLLCLSNASNPRDLVRISCPAIERSCLLRVMNIEAGRAMVAVLGRDIWT